MPRCIAMDISSRKFIRHKRPRIRTYLLAWAIIYCLALTVGTLMACVYSYHANENLPAIAEKDAKYYAETGSFPQKTILYQASAYVYDREGDLLNCHLGSGNQMEPARLAEKLSHQVLSSGTVYRMFVSRGLDSRIGLVVGTPLRERGEVTGVFFLVRGLTSLHNILTVLFFSLTAMLFLSCLYSALIIRNNRATDRIRREYVANVSHELKSPISSIRALAESIDDGVITDRERLHNCMRIILKEAQKLEHTVLSVLELSKIQSRQIDLSKSEVTAGGILEPALEKYSVLCGELGIKFHAPMDLAELPILLTNARAVAQVLDILLDNAVKFAGKGGNVWILLTQTSKCLTLCVKDDGAGISRECQTHIFERFYNCLLYTSRCV